MSGMSPSSSVFVLLLVALTVPAVVSDLAIGEPHLYRTHWEPHNLCVGQPQSVQAPFGVQCSGRLQYRTASIARLAVHES